MLALLLLPSILLAVLVFTRLSHHVKQSPRFKGVPRPPHLPHWIPFLGSALRMAGGDEFWAKTGRALGPAVRLTAVGDTRTFVMSPELISYVYKNSKNFDFLFFRQKMQSTIFGMDWDVSFDPIWRDKLYDMHHRAMQPGAITSLVSRYAEQLDKELEGRVVEGEVDLVEFAFDTIVSEAEVELKQYTASSKAWFSPSFPAAATKAPFLAFDKVFPILNLQAIPALARRPAEGARKEMHRLILDWWQSVEKEAYGELAPVMLGLVEAADEEGWSRTDMASMFLTELWALEANAPNIAIWTLVEILRHGKIVSRLLEEIEAAMRSSKPPTLAGLFHLPQAELVAGLPLLNACLQETLRLYTDSFSLRIVQNDCVLPAAMCQGGIGEESGLSLIAGEQVVCVTRPAAISPEGEWGKDAGEWDPARWEGKQRGPMNPFGGGVSMCEGRHFSSSEILTFLAGFLSLADVEIVKDSLTPDRTRVGLGALQFKGECRVRVRRR